MKKVLILLLVVFISGCGLFKPKEVIVEVPVYEVPKFDMPVRPILSSKGGTLNDVTKNTEKDLTDLEGYSIQLENLLKSLKSQKQ